MINNKNQLIRSVRLWLGLVASLLAIIIFSQAVSAAPTTKPTNSFSYSYSYSYNNNLKLVRLIDDNKINFIPTTTQTVSQFIKQQRIKLLPKDLIDPQLDAPIDNLVTTIKIKRFRLVEVIDGNRSTSIATTAINPRQIATEAGLSIHSQDKVKWIIRPTGSRKLTPTIKVIRAKVYTVNFVGKRQQRILSSQETVEGILADMNIKLTDQHTTHPSAKSQLAESQTIFVAQEPAKITTQFEIINYETIATHDLKLKTGRVIVDHAGSFGHKRTTSLNFQSANSQAQKIVIEDLFEPPQPEIIRYGVRNIDVDRVDENKEIIMRLAGVKKSDWGYVDFIIKHESYWSAAAENKRSGAYGICQSLPADKMADAGPDWRTNPITQMRWCDDYAQERYGGWRRAYNFWQDNRWW